MEPETWPEPLALPPGAPAAQTGSLPSERKAKIKSLATFSMPALAQSGLPLLKLTHRARKRILFFVDAKTFRFSYKTVGKSSVHEFSVDDVRGVYGGDEASVYREEFGVPKENEKQWLSLVYLDPAKQRLKLFHVLADSAHDMRKLLHVIGNFKRLRDDIAANFFMNIADLDDVEKGLVTDKAVEHRSKSLLLLSDVLRLSKRLNMNIGAEHLQSAFERVARDGVLDFEQFKQFVELLKQRDDLVLIWGARFGESAAHAEIARFLRECQGESPEMCDKIFSKFCGADQRWTAQSFSAYLSSHYCEHYRASFLEPGYYAHPLNEYFILSSHNTYLTGRQVAGDSSVEGYVRALQRGCRCIEVDIWNDGNSDEPIVNHGHTFTGRIGLRNVLRTIKKYAFYSSQFPVIISLEVHCLPKAQEHIVAALHDELGSQLVTAHAPLLPSPESLKGRFLVKVKRTSLYTATQVDDDGNFLSTSTSFSEDGASQTKFRRKKPFTQRVIEPLSSLGVCVQGIKFRNFSLPESKTFNHCFSLSEKLLNGMLHSAEKTTALVKHNRRYLMRVYPSKFRLKSLNFNPLPFWAHGVQMVATNWQTYDAGQQLNEAMFASTRNRGYVLKPEHLRVPKTCATKRVRFAITVVSAQQLPKPAGSSVVSPFVSFEVVGGTDVQLNAAATHVVEGNGYNPQWNFTFVGSAESECLFVRLVFQLSHKETKKLGVFTAKLHDLNQGYRYCPIYDMSGEALLYSSVLLHIDTVGPWQ